MSTVVTIKDPPTAAQVAALRAAGRGATVHHPRAGNPKVRRLLAKALGEAGLEPAVVRSLGWSTKGPAKPAVRVFVLPPAPDDFGDVD